jgi:alpha,alpha-trehalase
MAGQVDRARATFEGAAAIVNDVGLLSEEVDPATGELLGNFPQAFSHIGLVNAAWEISEAARRRAGKPACSYGKGRDEGVAVGRGRSPGYIVVRRTYFDLKK